MSDAGATLARLAAIMAALGTMPALAQIRETMRVPVVVQLEQAADPPLELSLVRSLDFGIVTIPNQFVRRDATCEYTAAATDFANGTFTMTEGSSRILPGSATSESGCHISTVGGVAVVAIRCEARRNILFTFSLSRVSISGLVLQPRLTAKLANVDGSQADFFANPGSASGKPCFPTSATPPTPVVTRQLSIGGSITVQAGQSLPTGRRIDAGAIVLEALYN
ncbi:MAG: hypothetical protein ABW039_08115 [Sphingobium sp.]